MSVYITQGRYTREAIKGMIAKPEDRAEAISKLFTAAGGKLLAYYLTFGRYDFLTIAEAPNEKAVASAILAAASGGGVAEFHTTIALTAAEAKDAFAHAGGLAKGFKSAGIG